MVAARSPREDFRAAVREAATYPGQSFAAIDRAGDAYATAVLLSLAAELEAESRHPAGYEGGGVGQAFSRAANLARERAHGKPGSAVAPSAQSGDARDAASLLRDPGAADCMEAGPE